MGGSVAPITASALTALIRGDSPVPTDTSLTYAETRWSYRQPISYELRNAAGEPVGTIGPVDGRTRQVSVVRVGEEPMLLLTVDRAGNTRVAHPDGSPVGEFRRRFAVFTFRMAVRDNGLTVGTLVCRGGTSATVTVPGGAVAARIRRSRGMRFAGASISETRLTGTEMHRLSGALLVAAVPALDAMRKAWRRSRFMSGGS